MENEINETILEIVEEIESHLIDTFDIRLRAIEIYNVFLNSQQQVKKLNIDDVSVSFSDSEKEEFIDTTIFLNSQNLTGRETEDELYKQGIEDCFDDLIENINER